MVGSLPTISSTSEKSSVDPKIKRSALRTCSELKCMTLTGSMCSGVQQALPASFKLRALLVTPDAPGAMTNTLSITPFSELAVSAATKVDGGITRTSANQARLMVTQLLGFDPTTVVPKSAGNAVTPNEQQLAVLLAAVSKLACDQFLPDLMRGDATSLEEAMDSLAIDRDSWLMEAAVFARMETSERLADGKFKAALPDLLRLALGQAGVKVNDRLRIRCVALLVSRYARSAASPEHPGLRDAAVGVVGNPWLRRASWDAHVVNTSKQPDKRAREMVFGWLKGKLIQDFFELLGDENAGDTRRRAYWHRFADFVDDMWFALGPAAQYRNDRKFREFKERAKGRLLDLEGASGDNNAFVMRIGAYVAIEFGAKGHAFYLLRWDAFRFHLSIAFTGGALWKLTTSTTRTGRNSASPPPSAVRLNL